MRDVEEVIAAYECGLDKHRIKECGICPWGYSYVVGGGWLACDFRAILDDAIEILKQRNSIDAAPVYWVKETDRTNHWRCPECGYTIGVADLADNFCPKCGIRIARKEGEKIDF